MAPKSKKAKKPAMKKTSPAKKKTKASKTVPAKAPARKPTARPAPKKAMMYPLFTALSRRGWTVRSRTSPQVLLPDSVARRYPMLPAEVVAFLSSIECCCNQKNDSWFLTSEDYARGPGPAFRWNEYECMALENLTDPRDIARVRPFWDSHFPFMLAVHSDYDYLAVCLRPDNFGSIVHGCAPEWEEPSPIAPSFSAFLEAFQSAAAKSQPEYPFNIFLHPSA